MKKSEQDNYICWVRGRYANLFLVNEGHLFIVDVSSRTDVTRIERALRNSFKRSLFDIDLIVITHRDPDHLTGASALKKASGARIAMLMPYYKAVAKFIREPSRLINRMTSSFRFFILKGGIKWRIRSIEKERSIPETGDIFTLPPRADVLLESNAPLPGHPDWQVIHTPGHSYESICIYNRERGIIFTGDTLVTQDGQVIPSPVVENRRELEKSLHGLNKLDVRALYPGHGAPVISTTDKVSLPKPV